MKTFAAISFRLLIIGNLAALLFLTACSHNKPIPPEGSTPNEYSAYLFSAANVLYYNNQFDRAEEVYRAALKFDPHSLEIRKAIFNALLNRAENKEISIDYFEGFVDTLLTRKAMDKVMLEQAYSVFIQNNRQLKAKKILDLYLKKYPSARAYTSLFYLEQTLYDRNRLELLDKAFKLAGQDASFLNSLGLLYLTFNASKAEKIWQQSRKYDTTSQSVRNLWDLYAKQNNPARLIAFWNSFQLPQDKDKMAEVLTHSIVNNNFASVLTLRDNIIESDDSGLYLCLLMASSMGDNDKVMLETMLKLEKKELTYLEKQLLFYYASLYNLANDNKSAAIEAFAGLDGRKALDDVLIAYRGNVLGKNTAKPDSVMQTTRIYLREVFASDSAHKLAEPVLSYIRIAIDSLKIDNQIELADSVALPCAEWYYNSNRRTYDTYFWLAQYYFRTKQDSLQKAILREALEEFPDDANLLNWLGYSYVLTGDNLEEAEVLIRRALQLSPDNPYYLDSLAWLFYVKGDYHTAIQLMDIPRRLESMPSEIALHIAKIFLALNETEAARDYLNLTIEINDDAAYAAQAKELLGKLAP